MGQYTEHLTLLRSTEISLIEAMAAGGLEFDEWEIRGRRVRTKDLASELLKVQKQIRYYESLENGRGGGSVARSRARIGY